MFTDGEFVPARYQIETPKDWDKIFNGFQKDKKTGTTPPAPRLRPSRTTVSAPGSPVRTSPPSS
ncbi:hypothetical protein ACFYPZ_03725 [Streptomyces sp. NPDC005506]|uniref:hypothetical protein n=1 Tax=Streptomyces sp. NPDC005506 TaxID=3364718 RepID=UPI00367A731C